MSGECEDTQPWESDALLDLLYTGWTIIANAGGGDWSNESPEWREAAARWRDRFHAALDAALDHTEDPS